MGGGSSKDGVWETQILTPIFHLLNTRPQGKPIHLLGSILILGKKSEVGKSPSSSLHRPVGSTTYRIIMRTLTDERHLKSKSARKERIFVDEPPAPA